MDIAHEMDKKVVPVRLERFARCKLAGEGLGCLK
jgi:hypothetical protein